MVSQEVRLFILLLKENSYSSLMCFQSYHSIFLTIDPLYYFMQMKINKLDISNYFF